MPDPDQESPTIDQRLKEGLAAIDLKLRDRLEELVVARTDRDRAFLKDVIGTATKILGFALTLVAIVLTITGIKTYKDIGDTIRSTTQREVENRLSTGDPTSPFRRQVDQLLNRAILDAYKLRLARTEDDPNASEVKITDADAVHIMALLSDPDTEIEDFTEALDVLGDADQERIVNRRNGRLQDLVGAEGDWAWMRRQPNKRALILERIPLAEYADVARPFLRAGVSSELRMAAVRLFRAYPDPKALDDIQTILDERPEVALQRVILSTLARHRPEARAFQAWTDTLKNASLRREHAFAFTLIEDLAGDSMPRVDESEVTRRRGQAKELIRLFFEKTGVLSTRRIATRTGVAVFASIPSDRLQLHIPLGNLTEGITGRLVLELLTDALHRKDDPSFRKLLRQVSPRAATARASLVLTGKPGDALQFVEKTDPPDRFWFFIDPKNRLFAVWRDPATGVSLHEVSGIAYPDKLVLSFAVDSL